MLEQFCILMVVVGVKDLPVYARVAIAESCRLSGFKNRHLFIVSALR